MHFPNIRNRIKYSFIACGLPSLETFIGYPIYDETKLFKKITIIDPVTKSSIIVQPLNFLDMLILILFNYNKTGYWRSGSLVAVSSLYGCLLNNIYQKIWSIEWMQKLRLHIKNNYKWINN
jgi:hypothetical protein